MEQAQQDKVVRHLRLREFLVGVEGLALMRELTSGDDAAAQARIDEIIRLVDPEQDATFGEGMDLVELEVVDLYRAWSATYDQSSRPVRAVEQPVVFALLEQSSPGRALDAACGTGRHAQRLAQLGHQVTGVDISPDMLERARELVPEARFEVGDVRNLPVPSASMDLAVCGLALDHLPTLKAPVAELARVVRPGGRVLISDVHPMVSALSGAAHVQLPQGQRGVVRNHAHLHSEYLDAFAQAGLDVVRCLEPLYGPEEVALKRTAMALVPEATLAAYVGLPCVLIWDLVHR